MQLVKGSTIYSRLLFLIIFPLLSPDIYVGCDRRDGGTIEHTQTLTCAERMWMRVKTRIKVRKTQWSRGEMLGRESITRHAAVQIKA